MMGWHLNIVEATIIILIVGLSFDFTLLYGVAYKMAPKGTRMERTVYASELIGTPIAMSALTNFLAGFPMVFAWTNAYYQIGLFMMLVSVISWFFSAFLFLALLSVFGPVNAGWFGCKSLHENDEKK